MSLHVCFWHKADITRLSSALLGYGPLLEHIYRDILSRQLVKLLHGVKPADIPVEQPTKFELAVNLKTAKTLGLTIPQSLLATADEVIE